MHNKLYIHNIDDYILIDDEDYERVKFYRWYQSTTQGATRISAQVLEVKVKLEDFIMNRKHCYQMDAQQYVERFYIICFKN